MLTACTSEKTPRAQTIVFFGDSLTEGVGVAPNEAYPALIQQKINAKKWPVTIVNAGVRGNTTSDGLARIDQVLAENPQIDVFVVALAANDIMRKLSMTEMETNLNTILDRVKAKHPQAKLMVMGVEFGLVLGMFAPRDIDEIFERVAEKHNAALVPSLLKGVLSKPDLNTPDGIHPNAAGQRVLAETVWEKIEGLL